MFKNEESIIVGFDFIGDIQMLADHLPNMKFFSYIENFVDAQDYYMKINHLKINQKPSLSKIVENLFPGMKLCKAEQLSNWERRPLR